MKPYFQLSALSILAMGVTLLTLPAQTTLTGDHIITGNLDVGNPTTNGNLKITGQTGNTASPGLRITGDGGVVFEGVYGTGLIPTTGAGVRFMWYSKKAAFRAGASSGTEWDDAHIGAYSAAFGLETMASGDFSTAFGDSTTAGGYGASAFGAGAVASGDLSSAFGENTTAQAYGSFVIGRNNIVEGSSGSWVASDPLFVIGNGTGATNHNAVTICKNGKINLFGSSSATPVIVLDADNSQITIGGQALLTPNASGNVGIGTTSPTGKLEINTVAAAAKGLVLKAAASQTANLQEWQDSSGSVRGLVNKEGLLSVGGNNDPTTSGAVILAKRTSLFSTGYLTGLMGDMRPSTLATRVRGVEGFATGPAVDAWGGYFSVGLGNGNVTRGYGSEFYVGVTHNSYAFTDAYAGKFWVGGYGTYTGSVTNAYGGHFSVVKNSASITNAYGVYIGTLNAVNNWALYSNNTATSYFGGKIGIGTTTPAEKLDVSGNARVTGSLTALQGMRTPAVGDLTMGTFVSGPQP